MWPLCRDAQQFFCNGGKRIPVGLRPAWATLDGAELREADLHLADLQLADLHGANLHDANL